MTNNQIIFDAEQTLAENGVIKYTGRVFKATTPEGEEIEVKETEQLHTYKEWQSLGYQVMKGQKAITKLTIWNFTNKASKAVREAAEKEGKEPPTNAHYYMKEAAFFSTSQVEPIKAEPKKEAPQLETIDKYVIDANYIDNLLANA